VFELSYLASTHRKRQSHDRLEFRSHATAAKTNMRPRTAWGPFYQQRSWWIGIELLLAVLSSFRTEENLVAGRRYRTGCQFSLNLSVRPSEG
jgi:hypothetical protein